VPHEGTIENTLIASGSTEDKQLPNINSS